MYIYKAAVWLEAKAQQTWKSLCEQDGFVELLPHVWQTQKIGSRVWLWHLGDKAGISKVVCNSHPHTALYWNSVEGLPTSGQLRLDPRGDRLYLEIECQTFPVWRLGQLLSSTNSPSIELQRRLQRWARQLERSVAPNAMLVKTSPRFDEGAPRL